MSIERRTRLATLLEPAMATAPSPLGVGPRVAAAATMALDATHVGLLVATDGIITPLEVGDDVGSLLDEQQFSLGDGPTPLATVASTPVLATDLTHSSGQRVWPLFGPVAAAHGVGSVVALPLRAGGARLGVLTCYRSIPSGPDDDQYADAVVLASLVTELLVAEQAGAGTTGLATGVRTGLDTQSVVHQAAGMLSEQLGIPIIEALVRLRAHAAASGQPLTVVGRSIVAGELLLEN